ncbi:hypothetical protein BU14_0014s0017 [Porphyra umbilicalis]|uniref:Sugar phosphate transporter domain-containing protein n=1 Tax=Porphyra umbilicalis TaxID=2786 RepID=A0A1X6PLC7_PORUM|nr:hypothetical protein BU14_0014s0017 [Porphyra umbilicalis]|eukprot:OSX81463.1 hypothetical protein BU14_0014s0017 [Porphyra umbilicalis]
MQAGTPAPGGAGGAAVVTAGNASPAEMEAATVEAVAPPAPSFLRYLPPWRVLVCVFGIMGSLMIYALLQERIMTKPYFLPGATEGGELFKTTLVLVLANRLVAAFLAGCMLLYRGSGELRAKAPIYKYMMISFSNVIATSCQYEALKWVTFPTQTLAKCAKMIPVMVWGTAMSGKKYSVVEYAVGVLVAIGCTIFLTSGSIKAKHAAASDSWWGLALMLGYLAFDGFTSTFQEKLFAGYSMSIYEQMMYVNGCSSIAALFFLVSSGKLWESLEFVTKFPAVSADMSVLSVSAVTGQFFITYTIKEFGALLLATIMTIRQFLSVLISNVVFAHHMSLMQWAGAVLVFGSLFYKSYAKASNKAAKPAAPAPAPAQA